jgi:hypothetical protein
VRGGRFPPRSTPPSPHRHLPYPTPQLLAVRVERWVDKLAQPTSNVLWKRNRNAYSALLLRAVTTQEFRPPLHRLPPEGDLPTLPADMRELAAMRPAHRSRPFWSDIYARLDISGRRSAADEQTFLLVPRAPAAPHPPAASAAAAVVHHSSTALPLMRGNAATVAELERIRQAVSSAAGRVAGLEATLMGSAPPPPLPPQPPAAPAVTSSSVRLLPTPAPGGAPLLPTPAAVVAGGGGGGGCGGGGGGGDRSAVAAVAAEAAAASAAESAAAAAAACSAATAAAAAAAAASPLPQPPASPPLIALVDRLRRTAAAAAAAASPASSPRGGQSHAVRPALSLARHGTPTRRANPPGGTPTTASHLSPSKAFPAARADGEPDANLRPPVIRVGMSPPPSNARAELLAFADAFVALNRCSSPSGIEPENAWA